MKHRNITSGLRRALVKCLTFAAALGCPVMVTAVPTNEVQALDSILAAATDFVRSGSSTDSRRLVVEAGTLDERLRLPACARQLQAFLPPGGKLVGNVTVGVRCPDGTGWTVYVPVRVKLNTPVLIAARPMTRGAFITSADLQQETRDAGALPGSVLTEPSQAIGRQASAPIPAGVVLNSAMIRPARLVKRGEKVTILASSGAFEVRAGGEALADGSEGETISVRNILTKKIIQATVAEAGLVRVRL
jgi:flagella basal body P-ring formation protein FlgA